METSSPSLLRFYVLQLSASQVEPLCRLTQPSAECPQVSQLVRKRVFSEIFKREQGFQGGLDGDLLPSGRPAAH